MYTPRPSFRLLVLVCFTSMMIFTLLVVHPSGPQEDSHARHVDRLINKAHIVFDAVARVGERPETAYFRQHDITPAVWGKTFNPTTCIRSYVLQQDLLKSEKPFKSWNTDFPSSGCPIYPIPSEGVLFHLHWDGFWQRDFSLTLDSFLATQNLRAGHRLIWWYEGQPPPQKVQERYAKIAPLTIQFKKLDRLAEGKGSCLENKSDWNSERHQVKVGMPPQGISDMLRILLLNKYGGVWVDSDTVFVRDITDLLRLGPVAPARFAPSGMYNNHFINVGPAPSPVAAKLLETICSLSFDPHEWQRKKYGFSPFAGRAFNDGLLHLCEHFTHCGLGVVPLAMVEANAWTEEDAPILKSCEANQTEISVNSALKKTWLWHFRRSCRDDLNDISMYPFAQVRRKVDAILKENLLHGKGMILPGA